MAFFISVETKFLLMFAAVRIIRSSFKRAGSREWENIPMSSHNVVIGSAILAAEVRRD